MPEPFNTLMCDVKDEWLTPPSITESLGHFDLDPCQPIDPPFVHADKGFNVLDNGLSRVWEGRVWCNPPYGRETFKWMKMLADHGDGIGMIFSRTETKGFHAQVFERASAILFLKGRIRFHHVNGDKADKDAAAPSCLIAYGLRNVIALESAVERGDLQGCVVRL